MVSFSITDNFLAVARNRFGHKLESFRRTTPLATPARGSHCCARIAAPHKVHCAGKAVCLRPSFTYSIYAGYGWDTLYYYTFQEWSLCLPSSMSHTSHKCVRWASL